MEGQFFFFSAGCVQLSETCVHVRMTIYGIVRTPYQTVVKLFLPESVCARREEEYRVQY